MGTDDNGLHIGAAGDEYDGNNRCDGVVYVLERRLYSQEDNRWGLRVFDYGDSGELGAVDERVRFKPYTPKCGWFAAVPPVELPVV